VPNCAIMIDGGYLDKVMAHDFANAHLDIGKLGDELAGGMERLRTYYYHCMPFQSTTPTPEERRRYSGMDAYISKLKKLPRFQFRQGKLQKIGNEYRQKRVDIWMAVDLVRMSSQKQIDKAVLMTGDSDLVPAIEAARDCGVIVVLFYSPNSRHDELLQACDERYEITRNLVEKTKLVTIARAVLAPPLAEGDGV
jgi:uncharacterized LabA/DUF88 family protein